MTNTTTQTSDWKSWWILNPWAPTGLAKHKWSLSKNQIEGFRRQNPKFVSDHKRLKLRGTQKQDDKREAIEKAWRYYMVNERSLSENDQAMPTGLLKMSMQDIEKDGYGFLKAGLRNYPGYTEWMEKNGSMISFLVHEFYPGSKYCEEHALFPERFPFSKTGVVTLERLAHVIAKTYLYREHIAGLSKEDAKKIFCSRHHEQAFLPRLELEGDFGINDRDITRFGVDKIRQEIAWQFDPSDRPRNPGWNSGKFKRDNENRLNGYCRYCKATPIDLHHLIPRSENSSLIYDPENVVELCCQAHQFIERKMSGDKKLERKYDLAKKEWQNKEQQKAEAFDDVMKEVHKRIAPER